MEESVKVMRRSMMTLALLIVTAGSNGCNEMGMGTRSCGPTGVDGTEMRYRTTGARGLFVCEPKWDVGEEGVDGLGGRS